MKKLISKVIHSFSLFFYRLTYTAYVFTGITGVVFFSSITRFSRVWFLPEQVYTLTLRKTQICSFELFLTLILNATKIVHVTSKILASDFNRTSLHIRQLRRLVASNCWSYTGYWSKFEISWRTQSWKEWNQKWNYQLSTYL